MRNTKHPRSTILLLTTLAVAGLGQAQEPAVPTDSTYQEKKNEANATAERRDYNRRPDSDDRSARNSAHGKHIQASKLIGKEVKNNQDERLGKIDDLIVSDDFSVKYAVLATGGALGVGSTKIAVPISDLQCGGDSVRLSASKDELKNAAKTPRGEWMVVSGQEWTRGIDGFYGHPVNTALRDSDDERGNRNFRESRESQDYQSNTSGTRWYEREALIPADRVHENVRAVKGQGAKELINHDSNANLYSEWYPEGTIPEGTATTSSDATLRQSINNSIHQDFRDSNARAVSVSVDNGVVTLRGTVATDAEKQSIESRVKTMSGVSRVNNQLNVRD